MQDRHPALYLLLSRPIGVVMIVLVFLFWGAYSLYNLPIGLQPSVEYPALSVITRYPGMHPEKIEQILTKPIEEEILGAGGIREMFSVSEEGESRINLILEPDVNVSLKGLEIQDRIGMISDNFPTESEDPVVVRYDPSQKPVVIIRLDSNSKSLLALREFAEKKVKPYLQRVEGTSEINIGGGKQREIKVLVNQRALAVAGFPISRVMNSIRENNTEIPAGELLNSEQRIGVRVLGYLTNPQQIATLPVATLDSNRLLRIRSVATVEDSYREPDSVSRENGKEIVSIYVHRASGANLVELSDQLHKSLEQIDWQGISHEISYDEAVFVKDAIDSVWSAIIQGGLASFLVLWLFLGTWRAAVAIGVAIPVSILLQFILLDQSGVGLNSVSMTALALGVGMLTDSAIIIIEYASRLAERTSVWEAIILSVAELWRELVASVGTTIAVFFPIFFASFEVRVQFLPLAITLSGALVISLLVTLFLIPLMLSRIPGALQVDFDNQHHQHHAFSGKPNRWKERFNGALDRWTVWLERIYRSYDRSLARLQAMSRRIPKLIVPAAALFSIIGILAFVALPESSGGGGPRDRIQATVELEPGTNLKASDRIVSKVVSLFSDDDGVEEVMTKVEKWRADLYIKIKDPDDGAEIVERLEGLSKQVPEAQVFFLDNEALAERQEVNIEINGYDLDTLTQLAQKVAKSIKDQPDVSQVVYRFKPGKPEYTFRLDSPSVSRAGLSAASVASDLKTAVDGSIPTKYLEEGREYDIRVQMVTELRSGTPAIEAYPFVLDKQTVPLAELAAANMAAGKGKIYRKNKQRQLSLTAVLETDDILGAVESLKESLAESVTLPDGYFIELTGKHEDIEKNRREMLRILATAFILMFCILALLFESIRVPLAILSILPPGLAIVFLFLFGFSVQLNSGVYVGLTLLIGLIVNNSIVLVSEIKSSTTELDAASPGLWDAIHAASLRRFRPILMTSLTTVTGLLPLLFSTSTGAELWRPLALTGCLGIVASMLLSLYLVPVLCHAHFAFFFRRG